MLLYKAQTNLENLALSERSQTQTATYCMKFTDMKYPKKAAPYSQKMDEWFPGQGEGGKSSDCFKGYRVSVWGVKNVLELDSGDGCTTL